MDLPNLLNRLRHKEEVVRRLLAIEITPTAAKSAVWQVQGSRTEVVTTGSIQAWDTDDINDLITAIDASLSESLAGLETEPNEVIFGLPETWVGSNGIVEGKKSILKDICHKLSLKAVGFVVTTEAVVQYLRELEGGPPSAILVNIGSDNVAVSIVYLGQLQGTQVVGKSDAISSDVEEGLARFPRTDNLPSRMILFDSREDLESAKQALISHDWQAHLPFLHFPKIESLPKDFTIRAIAISGGQEVAQSLGYTQENVIETDESVPVAPPSSPPPPPASPKETLPLKEPTLPDLANDFGFRQVDVNVVPVTSPSLPPTVPLTETEVPESLEPSVASKARGTRAFSFPTLPITQWIRSVKDRLSHLSFRRKKTSFKPSTAKKRFPVKVLGLVLGLGVVLAAGSMWAYWQFPKATLTIFVTSHPLEKTVTFVLNPQSNSVDLQRNMLPGEVDSVEVSGSKSLSTTGKKTIGDRAKGEVLVYNRTTTPKSFSAGTAIKYQNLRFTLDKDVTVASASTKYNADFSVVTEPSKISVSVTAVDIGEKFNLPANTQFQVNTFSTDSYIASNQTAFVGGSAQEVAAVSEADRKNLKDALIQELKEEVRNQVQAKSGNREVITTDDQTIGSENYSAKVGEETGTLQLTLSVAQTVYTYSMDDLTLLAQQAAFNDIPPGNSIQTNRTQVNISDTTINDDNTVTIKAVATLSLLPKLNTAEIARSIRGKQPSAVSEFLREQPGFNRTSIAFSPKLPGFLNTFPKRVENITVNVEPAN